VKILLSRGTSLGYITISGNNSGKMKDNLLTTISGDKNSTMRAAWKLKHR